MPAPDAILSDLTPPQREAVTHRDDPLLVVAGAGSGKTRVITRRVAWLASQGVSPFRILAVTFTNKAANEMRERIERLAGTRGAWVSTFHSLCARMLRMSADHAGLPRNYTIYDRDDQLKAVKAALDRLELGGQLTPATALHAISQAKASLQSPEQFAQAGVGFRDELVARAYRAYSEILAANAALDFDDLLMRVALLLHDDAEFRDRWQRRFDYLLIDEYQDTNRAQHLIARRLAAQHRNICATGDPDQSIYGWRGACIGNILGFEEDYPEARVVRLERNYRSTKTILRAADSVITRNTARLQRGLWTENEDGVALCFLLAEDARDEAQRVLAAIRERHDDGRPWNAFAIFYRTNAQSRAFEEALRRSGVPYGIVGAVEFYRRQEVKDLLAYLHVCLNERDDLSLERIINTPARGIGAKTVDRLKAWAAREGVSLWAAVSHADAVEAIAARGTRAVGQFRDLIECLRQAEKRPVARFCDRVLRESGYRGWLKEPENEERLANVQAFLDGAAEFDERHPEGDLADFLQEVALVSDVDNYDGSAEKVTLMTLHSAKGLEFPVVLLTGLEEGLLPHANSIREDGDAEEERRLCYVGMTRAQKELILTAARERAQFGASGSDEEDGRSSWSRHPSRFLHELDSSVLDEVSRGRLSEFATAGDAAWFAEPAWRSWRSRGRGGAARRPARRAPEAEPLAGKPLLGFAVGDRVQHPDYGEGRIVGLQVSERLSLATVAMDGGGKRIFSLEHAKLRKL